MSTQSMKIRAGFTLVEILIVVSLVVIAFGATFSFFGQGINIWQSVTTQSELRHGGRNAMLYMTQELHKTTRTSSTIPSPNLAIPAQPNNDSVGFYLPTDIDGNGTIVDANGNTEWDTDNQVQYQYIPASKQLRRSAQGIVSTIADNVASVEFEDVSIDTALYTNEVKIILILEKAIPRNRTISVQLTSIVKLRNL